MGQVTGWGCVGRAKTRARASWSNRKRLGMWVGLRLDLRLGRATENGWGCVGGAKARARDS